MFGVPTYAATVFMTMCVSALALTSLDAVARIARMSFQELFSVDDLAAIGEVGLTGEIRAVSHLNQRLAEIMRLGFKKCIIPKSGSDKAEIPAGLTVYRVKNLREAVEIAL